MIVFEGRPAQYRGTIEVYATCRFDGCDGGDDCDVPDTEWRWRCRSRNNTILASGEGYRRRAGALNAIDAQYAVKLTGRAESTLIWDSVPMMLRDIILPWRLVIVDRHHDTTTGAVY